MPMTNAEKQAAFRARRAARLTAIKDMIAHMIKTGRDADTTDDLIALQTEIEKL